MLQRVYRYKHKSKSDQAINICGLKHLRTFFAISEISQRSICAHMCMEYIDVLYVPVCVTVVVQGCVYFAFFSAFMYNYAYTVLYIFTLITLTYL